MVKAEELVKQQKERESRKYITFEKIYSQIDKKICMASAANFYYTWFQIPEFLIGMPIYSFEECKKYIEDKLKQNNFKTEFYQPNILFITWKS
jgi:hypothetical protein